MYPSIEPFATGHLDVGDGNAIYWEVCGNPSGKPAVVLHGGPGSGCSPWFRRLFDPGAYRIVLFDQRNCGRSRPHASAAQTDLSSNTTANLVRDIETLRESLNIEKWLVLGGSWGCVLALAYAESHPTRVTEMVLIGVTSGRHVEVDWLFRGGLARFFPQQWERLAGGIPDHEVVNVYADRLSSADPNERRKAADECASGNPRRRTGHRTRLSTRGFATATTRWRSPASSPTTFATIFFCATTSCCAARPPSATFR